MEDAFQKRVLGSDISPSHWKLKYTKVHDAPLIIDPIQVQNYVGRCMIAHVDAIVEAAIPEGDNDRHQKLILAVSKYGKGRKILTLHRGLDDEEKELFQDHIDDFFELWVDLFGEEGLSNYIHLLGAGHMLYFLEKYECLYLFSQQGWEELNNRC